MCQVQISCWAQHVPLLQASQLCHLLLRTPIYWFVVQAFQSMAKRESIRRAVERKTADFQRLFIDDLNMVKKQFDLLKRVPAADPVLPRYAGQATAALVLAKRVDHTWQALQVSIYLYHSVCSRSASIHCSCRLHVVCGASMHCNGFSDTCNPCVPCNTLPRS